MNPETARRANSLVLGTIALIFIIAIAVMFRSNVVGQALLQPSKLSVAIDEPSPLDEPVIGDFPSTGSENGIERKTYIYSTNLLASKSSLTPEETTYYLQDHAVNTVAVTGVTEDEHLAYDPFGNERLPATGPDLTHYKFSSKEQDESGLYYYGARYYNPEIGRFLQPDALQGSQEDPIGMQRYGYVRNNPLRYVDPTGNAELEASVVNILGQTVQSGIKGQDRITWDLTASSGNKVASGVYFVQVMNKEDNSVFVDKVAVVGGKLVGANSVSIGNTQQDQSSYTYDLQTIENSKKMDIVPDDNDGQTDQGYTQGKQIEVDYGGSITINFRAPGDDGNVGTADRYSLAYSTTPIETKDQFDASKKLPQIMLPKPKVAGTPQSVIFPASIVVEDVTQKETKVYVSIIAFDEAKNRAPPSNNWVVTVKQH